MYSGPDEIRRYTEEDLLANLEGAAIAGEEFTDAGDSVVVHVKQSATGAGSGASVAVRYYLVPSHSTAQPTLSRRLLRGGAHQAGELSSLSG